MAIRKYKPTSAGRRAGSVSDFSEITTSGNDPEKCLLVRQRKTGGRNNQGKITARHRGGGHKQMYRQIDLLRSVCDVDGTVKAIEYDPCRTARIALIYFANGRKSYVLAAEGMKVGDVIRSSKLGLEPDTGNCMPLASIPLGSQIHNVELYPGAGGQLCRTAGAFAVLNARDKDWAQIALPSGEIRRVPVACRATIGVIGNAEHQNVQIGKAGRARWMGRRPYVRGVAQNPIAHPMGGGEGRTSGGRHPCSPTGKLSKGGATRKRRKASSRAIVRRRRSRRNGQLIT